MLQIAWERAAVVAIVERRAPDAASSRGGGSVTTPAGWVSVAAAARQLALSERQVWSLIADKKIPSVLAGGRRLIDPAGIDSRKKTKKGSEVQFKLQSESVYTRIVRLEKQVEFLQKELKNGR